MCTFLATQRLFFQTGNCLLCMGRDHRPLRATFLRLVPLALFHDARLEPFLDQADHASISNPMFHKSNQPTVLEFVVGRDGSRD